MYNNPVLHHKAEPMRLLQQFFLTMLLVLVGFMCIGQPLMAQSASEQSLCEGSGGRYSAGDGSCSNGDAADTRTLQSTIGQVVGLLMFIVGIFSVVALILGGLRYVMANGDQSAIGTAKTMILYAVIGLIVAMSAGAVVQFLTGKFAV